MKKRHRECVIATDTRVVGGLPASTPAVSRGPRFGTGRKEEAARQLGGLASPRTRVCASYPPSCLSKQTTAA